MPDPRRPSDADRARQGGYAMVTVMLTMLVLGALVLAALAVADTSSQQSGRDTSAKKAMSAARAGVALYATRLAKNPDYWRQCGTVTDAPVWTGTETPRWQRVESGGDRFSVEILPAPGYTRCDGANAGSVFDPTTNTIGVRVTGEVAGTYRTLIARYRRGSFLDYVYFTQQENLDPLLYTTSASRIAACGQGRKRVQRDASGQSCTEIQFVPADAVDGTAHTNDSSFLLCGSVRLSRAEASSSTPAKQNTGCSGTPAGFFGNQPEPELPSSPKDILLEVATNSQGGQYLFTGKVDLRFDNSDPNDPRVWVRQGSASAETSYPLPESGVIYARQTGCSVTSTPQNEDYVGEPNACAFVRVRGEMGGSVTVVSENDIIINGNLTKGADDVVSGLVADNFVRVQHRGPTRECSAQFGGTCFQYTTRCPTGANANLSNPRVDAAILALNHSFLVDNWSSCPNGSLSVNGAIVQYFRGPVAQGSGSTLNGGYVKDYSYDPLLKSKGPPYFPPPPSSDWRPIRVTEQLPGARPAG